MAEVKPKKLPYAGVGAIDRFFDTIRPIRDPGRVDAEWTEKQGVGEGVAIPTMLKWLGVVDDDYKPVTPKLWEDLRLPDTRQATLRQLVETSYGDVFKAVDVSQARRNDLRVAFERTYKLGHAGDRVITFLKLCDIAGIPLKALDSTRPGKAQTNKPKPKPGEPTPPKSGKTPTPPRAPQQRQDLQHPPALGVTISVSVEIPADWTEEQVKARLAAVARAAKEIDVGRV